MKSTNHALALSLTALFGGLAVGCAASLCQLGEPSVNCCVKKFPLTPEQSCGVSAAEAAALLQAMQMAGDVAAEEAMAQRDEAAKGTAVDDPDEGWREHCRDNYVLCKDQKKPRWVGDCYACFRNCEGQKQWPFDLCHPKRR
jgi:hypothetical protein